MKKIIAILLVLSVMFVAFGASNVGSTTLTLKSTVGGKLFHGFTNTELSTKANVKAIEAGGGNLDFGNYTTSSALDLLNGNAQTLGYYGFYITGNAQVDVDFSTNNRVTTTANTKIWEVPYQLKVIKGLNGGPRGLGGVPTKTIGIAPVAGAVVSGATDATSHKILTTSGSGLGYQAFSLTATFVGEYNDVLPEGDYTGTIVAAVTTK